MAEKMKKTLGELFLMVNAPPGSEKGEESPLTALMRNKGLAARVAFKIACVGKPVYEQMDAFDKAKRGLVEKFGEKDADGGISVKPASPNWPAFEREYLALMATEVELDIKPVELPPDLPGVTAEQLLRLDGIVTVKD
jgi:hypothetical protein